MGIYQNFNYCMCHVVAKDKVTWIFILLIKPVHTRNMGYMLARDYKQCVSLMDIRIVPVRCTLA